MVILYYTTICNARPNRSVVCPNSLFDVAMTYLCSKLSDDEFYHLGTRCFVYQDVHANGMRDFKLHTMSLS
jgi:hypothetical protein